MPAWSPGAYMLHWAAKNVQELWAEDGEGRALEAQPVDTSLWRIKPIAPLVRVHYYEVAIRNPHNYDRYGFREDIRRIVAEQVEMMGGAPYQRYVFLFRGINQRGGGLEHLNSTTISFKRYGVTSSADYKRLQFLIAHEYFHLDDVFRRLMAEHGLPKPGFAEVGGFRNVVEAVAMRDAWLQPYADEPTSTAR